MYHIFIFFLKIITKIFKDNLEYSLNIFVIIFNVFLIYLNLFSLFLIKISSNLDNSFIKNTKNFI